MTGRLKKRISIGVFAVFLLLLGAGIPGLFLVKKPANQQPFYASGWADGCGTAVASYAPLRVLFSSRSFVKQTEEYTNAVVEQEKEKNPDTFEQNKAAIYAYISEYYKTGWNEAYVVCRFYQESTMHLFAFLSILAAIICTRCRCGRNTDAAG